MRWTSLKTNVLQVLLAARPWKEELQDEDQEPYQVQPHPVNFILHNQQAQQFLKEFFNFGIIF